MEIVCDKCGKDMFPMIHSECWCADDACPCELSFSDLDSLQDVLETRWTLAESLPHLEPGGE